MGSRTTAAVVYVMAGYHCRHCRPFRFRGAADMVTDELFAPDKVTRWALHGTLAGMPERAP